MTEQVNKRAFNSKLFTKIRTKYKLEPTNRIFKSNKIKNNPTNLELCMHQMFNIQYIISLIFGLFVGYIFMFISLYQTEINTEYIHPNSILSTHKMQLQKEFISVIDKVQSNCSNRNILVMELFGESIGEMHHFVGQALLIAVATNRRLHIVNGFINKPITKHWNTMYKPLSNCKITVSQTEPIDIQWPAVWKYYAQSTDTILYFDNIKWAEMSRHSRFIWNNGVFNTKWFGKYGNVFVRSFIQYYIWKKMKHNVFDNIYNNVIIKQIQKYKHGNNKFITVYVDQEQRKHNMFRVYMEKHIELIHKLSSDLLNDGGKLKSIVIGNVSRNDVDLKGELYIENLNDGLLDEMITVEILRLSNYVSGSARNSLYRLGMELQYATNWISYDYVCEQNVYSIDIPWLVDP
eukprot:420884_1